MLIGIAAGLAAGALWGLVFVAPLMVPGLSAVDFTVGRFLSFGAWSLLLMLALRQSTWPNARQAVAALGMSVLGFAGYYLLLVLAVRDAGVEVPSLIIGTIPLWMMLLGRPVGLRLGQLVPGLVLTLLGLGLMVYGSFHGMVLLASGALSGPYFWRGVMLAVASMALWTAFGLLNAAWLKKHPDVSAATWANWLGVATGLGALLLWLLEGSDTKVLASLTGRSQIAMICIATGLGSAWLATVLWNMASQRLSASLCGQLIVSETLFALFYAFIWNAQWPTMLQCVAGMLFIAGILASIWAHRQPDLQQ